MTWYCRNTLYLLLFIFTVLWKSDPQ